MKVQFTDEQVGLIRAALEQWGIEAQIGKTVEECAELIVALQKYVNRSPQPGTVDGILDEIADVEMMLAQMRYILGISDDDLHQRIKSKFEMLSGYLYNEEKPVSKAPGGNGK